MEINHRLRVVVPIYRDVQDSIEYTSLTSMYRLLADRYPIAVVAPEGVDLPCLERWFPKMEVRRLPAEHFVSITAYNRMMMRPEFYDLFAQDQYILIYQTDCYLFEDRLEEFMASGHDYCGAPWVPKIKHEQGWYKKAIAVCGWGYRLLGREVPLRWRKIGRVGNGGLCLRRVEAMRWAVRTYAQQAERCADPGPNYSAEDLFFSLKVPQLQVAPFDVGLRFAFDQRPERAWELNQQRLPMGCHAWHRPAMWPFWKSRINMVLIPDMTEYLCDNL